jgi:hypothetical protein
VKHNQKPGGYTQQSFLAFYDYFFCIIADFLCGILQHHPKYWDLPVIPGYRGCNNGGLMGALELQVARVKIADGILIKKGIILT